jgi:hypothetical protein
MRKTKELLVGGHVHQDESSWWTCPPG